MLNDARKIHIIEEVLKVSDDKTLNEIEAVIKKAQKGKGAKAATKTYGDHWEDPAFVAEMDRRYNDMITGKDKGHTWEEVKERARKAVAAARP